MHPIRFPPIHLVNSKILSRRQQFQRSDTGSLVYSRKSEHWIGPRTYPPSHSWYYSFQPHQTSATVITSSSNYVGVPFPQKPGEKSKEIEFYHRGFALLNPLDVDTIPDPRRLSNWYATHVGKVGVLGGVLIWSGFHSKCRNKADSPHPPPTSESLVAKHVVLSASCGILTPRVPLRLLRIPVLEISSTHDGFSSAWNSWQNLPVCLIRCPGCLSLPLRVVGKMAENKHQATRTAICEVCRPINRKTIEVLYSNMIFHVSSHSAEYVDYKRHFDDSPDAESVWCSVHNGVL